MRSRTTGEGWIHHQSTRRDFIRTMAAGASSVAAPAFLPFSVLGRPAASGWDFGPFVKHKEPVLQPTPDSLFTCPIRGTDVRWEEQNTYNPAAVVRGGKVYLLYRADDRSPDLRWGRTCRIGLAHSDDGVHFTRNTKPVLYPDNDQWKRYEWEGGCEDLHIIEDEDGTYYMNYTTWSGKRDTMSVATSRDLVHWTKHGPAFRNSAPEKVYGSRSGVVVSRREGDRLIAAKLDDKYWMYYTHPCGIAWSENLIDWVPTGKAVWPGGGREAGAIALLRDKGILLMTQGGHHRLGAWTLRQALIDANDRKTVLKEQKEPFLWPEYDWEKKGLCWKHDGGQRARAIPGQVDALLWWSRSGDRACHLRVKLYSESGGLGVIAVRITARLDQSMPAT